MRWMHLSDIHFADLGFSTEKLKNSLLAKLKELSPDLDFIIITGDCFYRNDSSKNIMPELCEFITTIMRLCKVEKGGLFICQGNHDLNRDNIERNKYVEEARKKAALSTEDFNKLKAWSNDNFRSLFRAIKKKEYMDFDLIEPKNLPLRIVSLNSCLLSKDNEDYQKLRVCAPVLEEISKRIKEDDRLNLLMMHHGLDWLVPDDRKTFEHWVEDQGIDALFVGHTHQPNVLALSDVNRDIYQFTSGALMLDGHVIPSFFMCEEKEGILTLTLYSYSSNTDSWEVDNHSLRKFKNEGRHSFLLKRKLTEPTHAYSDLSELSCEEIIDGLNEAYENKYGTIRFFSDKTSEYEDFNAWKIVGSLAGIGLPYPVSLRLAIKTVEQITSNDYLADDLIHSSTIKSIIYENILSIHNTYPELSEYDIGIWANRYSRHYNKDIGFSAVEGDKEELISYNLLKNSILKEVIVRITGNEIYYRKITTSDLEKMSSEIMRFIKSLGISKICKEVLYEIIIEYVSEPPHPWFVNNNRKKLFEEHRNEADRYMSYLINRSDINPIFQIEAAYHIFAGFLTLYDDYIGCTDIGPITIIKNSISQIGTKSDDNLPMRRCMLIQLKEDLKENNVQFDYFRKQVGIIYKNIVEGKNVTAEETRKALIELRDILSRLEDQTIENWNNTGNAFRDVYRVFHNAIGFIVRDPVRQFGGKAFVVAPYWDNYQKRQYNLGDDILVCMLDNEATFNLLCNYLSQKRKQIIQELVLFKSDVSQFTPEERKEIRERLKMSEVYVRCIFIQEQNFQFIYQNGWRKVFFDIVKESKNSMWQRK